MGLLVPLFAFGVALIGIPYFVHRIRRPERETVRFSSLMFVPDVKREVIERRRIQHIVLMLLRNGGAGRPGTCVCAAFPGDDVECRGGGFGNDGSCNCDGCFAEYGI